MLDGIGPAVVQWGGSPWERHEYAYLEYVMTQAQAVRRGPKPNPHTRTRLLSAGVDMIHAGGFAATGVKDIVVAAGVPKGSFYNHFASKEAFAAEVVDAYFAVNAQSMRRILQDTRTAPVDRLRSYFADRTDRMRASGYTRGCLLGNLTLEMADHSELVRERVAEHFATWSGLFEDCIAQAHEDGDITGSLPPSLLADFLLNSWEGALLRARSENDDAPLREFVEVVFGSMLA